MPPERLPDEAEPAHLDPSQLTRTGEALAGQAAQARKRALEVRARAAQTSARSRTRVESAQSAVRTAKDWMAQPGSPESVALFDADPDLAAGVPAAERELARQRSVVRTALLTGSRWSSQLMTRPAGAEWLGLYVLDGVLMRRVRTGSGTGSEVLGTGDVLRPWDNDGPFDPLPVSVAWMALAPVHVAILDEDFALRVARWPSVVGALMARLVARAKLLTLRHVARTFPRVDVRVLLTLWVLAQRWGTVGPNGVFVRLPLTHQMLSTLVGAQRPSTTLALDALRRRGWVLRQGSDGWIITHDAIAHLAELTAVPALFEA